MADSIYLASQSPRRQALLRQIGVPFIPRRADIDEAPQPGESPLELAQRLATAKALAVDRHSSDGRPALGADTVVSLDGESVGQATSSEQARRMLSRLSGRTHEVITAVAICHGVVRHQAYSRSTVRFKALSDSELDRYARSLEPLGKAGGYAIQGMGAVLVAELNGSFSGVMGLPLFETAKLLSNIGLPAWLSGEPS